MRSASETKLERLANHLTKAYFPDCQKSPFKMPIRSIEHGPRGRIDFSTDSGKIYIIKSNSYIK